MNRQELGRQALREILQQVKAEKLRARKQAAHTIIQTLLQAGMTQQQIANGIGISQASISDALAGKRTPKATTLTCLLHLARNRSIELPELDWQPPQSTESTTENQGQTEESLALEIPPDWP